uniref:Uncharacterized protein n=1 Tax=Naja naja TaxID=35670 RepID=A0A8C7E5A1_NAJNA
YETLFAKRGTTLILTTSLALATEIRGLDCGRKARTTRIWGSFPITTGQLACFSLKERLFFVRTFFFLLHKLFRSVLLLGGLFITVASLHNL